MLQHEQTDPLPVSPTLPLPVSNAADARVTPDELNAALKALEDQQNSTVAIGSVVDELRLNATPEEIWAQVEKQRAEAVSKPQVQAVPVTQNKKLRWWTSSGWHGISGWIWVLFWCSGGLGLFAGLPHLLSQTVTITGDSTTEAVPAQGKNILILGDGDKITLLGHAHSVIILGDKTTLRGEAPKVYESLGDHNDVQWNSKPQAEN